MLVNHDITVQLLLMKRARSASGKHKESSRDPLGGNESQPLDYMPRQNYVKITRDRGHRVANLGHLANVFRIYRHQRLLTRVHTFHRTLLEA